MEKEELIRNTTGEMPAKSDVADDDELIAILHGSPARDRATWAY